MGYKKMNIKFNITDSKKDLVKAGNTKTMFKDVIGKKLVITGLIVYDNEEVDQKTGAVETKTVSAIKLKDGSFISSISPTVEKSLTLIASSYEEEEIKKGIEVEVKSQKSNGGRDFLYIDLV
jgi:pantothenate kinase type III